MKENFKLRTEKIEEIFRLRKKYLQSEKEMSEDLDTDLINYLDCLHELSDFEMQHYLMSLYGD